MPLFLKGRSEAGTGSYFINQESNRSPQIQGEPHNISLQSFRLPPQVPLRVFQLSPPSLLETLNHFCMEPCGLLQCCILTLHVQLGEHGI